MNRDEQEMTLWREAYILALSQTWACPKVDEAADAAVAEFRKRYPAEPTAPEAVWYDEPPFEKDGNYHPCWIQRATGVRIIYWSVLANEWECYDTIQGGLTPLAGRRVCPIHKPQEPTT